MSKRGPAAWTAFLCFMVAPATAEAKLRVDFYPPKRPEAYWVVRVGLIDPGLRDLRALARALPTAGYRHGFEEPPRLVAGSRYLIYPVCNGVARPEHKPATAAQAIVWLRCP